MARRLLTFEDRAQIAAGIKQGLSNTPIGRDRTVVWRERGRNSLKTRGYQPVNENEMAVKRRQREQTRKIDGDAVLAVLSEEGSLKVLEICILFSAWCLSNKF